MMKVWHLPLEKYETRYTADWEGDFEREFTRLRVNFETVRGQCLGRCETGKDPLDGCGTTYWKATQFSRMAGLITTGQVKDGDVVFLADIWNPDVLHLFYLRDMLGLKFKVAGVLHAGTYDRADFTYRLGMAEWGRDFEKSLLKGADYVFVATDFHKSLLRLTHDCGNVVVTGIPFYANRLKSKYGNVGKDKSLVVFPHRLAPEKHPEKFDQLAALLGPDFKCVKTMEVCKTRDDYFRLLAKAGYMVSFADQETFGFSTVEALALGCVVYAPDDLSYVETVPVGQRYRRDAPRIVEMLADRISRGCDNPFSGDLDKWSRSVERMVNVMKGE